MKIIGLFHKLPIHDEQLYKLLEFVSHNLYITVSEGLALYQKVGAKMEHVKIKTGKKKYTKKETTDEFRIPIGTILYTATTGVKEGKTCADSLHEYCCEESVSRSVGSERKKVVEISGLTTTLYRGGGSGIMSFLDHWQQYKQEVVSQQDSERTPRVYEERNERLKRDLDIHRQLNSTELQRNGMINLLMEENSSTIMNLLGHPGDSTGFSRDILEDISEEDLKNLVIKILSIKYNIYPSDTTGFSNEKLIQYLFTTLENAILVELETMGEELELEIAGEGDREIPKTAVMDLKFNSTQGRGVAGADWLMNPTEHLSGLLSMRHRETDMRETIAEVKYTQAIPFVKFTTNVAPNILLPPQKVASVFCIKCVSDKNEPYITRITDNKGMMGYFESMRRAWEYCSGNFTDESIKIDISIEGIYRGTLREFCQNIINILKGDKMETTGVWLYYFKIFQHYLKDGFETQMSPRYKGYLGKGGSIISIIGAATGLIGIFTLAAPLATFIAVSGVVLGTVGGLQAIDKEIADESSRRAQEKKVDLKGISFEGAKESITQEQLDIINKKIVLLGNILNNVLNSVVPFGDDFYSLFDLLELMISLEEEEYIDTCNKVCVNQGLSGDIEGSTRGQQHIKALETKFQHLIRDSKSAEILEKLSFNIDEISKLFEEWKVMASEKKQTSELLKRATQTRTKKREREKAILNSLPDMINRIEQEINSNNSAQLDQYWKSMVRATSPSILPETTQPESILEKIPALPRPVTPSSDPGTTPPRSPKDYVTPLPTTTTPSSPPEITLPGGQADTGQSSTVPITYQEKLPSNTPTQQPSGSVAQGGGYVKNKKKTKRNKTKRNISIENRSKRKRTKRNRSKRKRTKKKDINEIKNLKERKYKKPGRNTRNKNKVKKTKRKLK